MLHLVYSPSYNYHAPRLFPHPFNPSKAREIFDYLLNHTDHDINVIPVNRPVTQTDLLTVHDPTYLAGLTSAYVSHAIDLHNLLKFCPQRYIESCLLSPMRWQTAGTLKATQKAMENNSCVINLGGGFHHAQKSKGWGGCIYADIPLAIKTYCADKRVAIIDLDAHQGDGLTEFALAEQNVYLFDMFNKNEFPFSFHDLQRADRIVYHGLDGGHLEARLFGYDLTKYNYLNIFDTVINRNVSDDEYLSVLETNLDEFLDRAKPDIVFYNMGSDPYINDPWGCMRISKHGILRRDQYVYDCVRRRRNIPLVITLSGGYAKDNVALVGDSILNLCGSLQK